MEGRPSPLADRLHVLLSNRGEFSPRQSFLRYYGKARAFNVAIDSFGDYYSSRIPDYEVGNHMNNAWLNERISAQYEIDLFTDNHYSFFSLDKVLANNNHYILPL